ncbi:2'-5' RNA ligase family protein [Actinoplanes sp. NPDC024001]|uniref:2'-5' RNA ligase family protein n=1 Tax=Actinoplanes sp. NPDC024001 TaxID=3154598 RepID=UPI0033F27CA7
MHTIELLLDARLDAGVRDVWRRLHAAGLRSLATHTHPSNRPHVTLVSAARLDSAPPALALPVDVEVGEVTFLGRALVRAVTGPGLRELQAGVWNAVEPVNPLHAPDRWIPHVSLALNVPTAEHDAALDLLRDLKPAYGQLTAARSYDTGSRTVTAYPSRNALEPDDRRPATPTA